MSDNKLKLIQDIELDNLNDENDFLETRKYSDTLQEIIKTSHTPCTIGLFGEWGSGKSSIIRDVINKLDYNKSKQHYKDTNEKIRFVVYDAWKYSKDSFRRTFLLEMAKELKFQEQDYFDMFYANQSDEKIKRSLEVANAFVELVKAIGGGIPNPINVIEKTKITTQKPFIFAPEQFENLFDEMLEKSLGVKSIFARAVDYFKKDGYEAKINKLVIVIDNLDRCNADTVCEMLSDIKGFLNKDKVVFIVPLDDKMLKKHLEKINGYEDSESSEYLRKIFDCVLSLKKTQEFDMYEVLDKLLKNHKIEYNPNTMGVISEEYASNPRRIIKFINNFEIEKKLLLSKGKIKKDFINQNETLIAFLLILREDWINIYVEIVRDINNLHHLMGRETIRIKPVVSLDRLSSNLVDKKLKLFLEHNENIWRKANLYNASIIVSNLDSYYKLSDDVFNKITNDDFKAIEDDLEQKAVIDYLVFNFKKWCDREAYETNALNFLKKIILINQIVRLDDEKLQIVCKNKYGLFKTLENIPNDNKIILYAFNFIDCCNDEVIMEYLENLKDKFNFINDRFLYEGFERIDNYRVDDRIKEKYNNINIIYTKGMEYFLNSKIKIDNYEEIKIYFYIHSYFNNYEPYFNLKDEVFIKIFNEDIIDNIVNHKIDYMVLAKLMLRMYSLDVINIGKACDLVLNISSDNLTNSDKLECLKMILKNVDSVDMASFNNDKYLGLLSSIYINIELEIKFILDKFAKNTSSNVFCHFIEQFFKIKIEQEEPKVDVSYLEKRIASIYYCINNYDDFSEDVLLLFIDNVGKYFYISEAYSILLYIYSFFKQISTKLNNKILSHLDFILNFHINNDVNIDINFQSFLIKLSDNIELKNEIIKRLPKYKDCSSMVSEEFKEIFFKGEKDA